MSLKQHQARKAVDDSQILHQLSDFSPELVSTIFVNLDIDSSDIDIVCCHSEAESLVQVLTGTYSSADGFEAQVTGEVIVVGFWLAGFMFEVYSSTTPVKMQLGYRHFRAMERLVAIGGGRFSARIRELKTAGLKTEPAIAQFLALPGEPYAAVLGLESWSDEELKERIQQSV